MQPLSETRNVSERDQSLAVDGSFAWARGSLSIFNISTFKMLVCPQQSQCGVRKTLWPTTRAFCNPPSRRGVEAPTDAINATAFIHRATARSRHSAVCGGRDRGFARGLPAFVRIFLKGDLTRIYINNGGTFPLKRPLPRDGRKSARARTFNGAFSASRSRRRRLPDCRPAFNAAKTRSQKIRSNGEFSALSSN